MNKLFTTGLIASLMAVTYINSAPVFAEGYIGAGSEATCSNGFPVLTGPGATVLTPAGAFTMGMDGPPMQNVYNPNQKDYSVTGVTPAQAEVKKEIKAQVKNYSWGNHPSASARYAYKPGSRSVALSKFFAQY